MLLRTCALAAVASIVGTVAAAQSLTGYRYSIRMTSETKGDHLASVRDAGDRMRFDFDSDKGYLLVLERGSRIISVHPRDREYNEVADTTLERVIGRALRTVSNTGLVEFRVDRADVQSRFIGDGGMVAGRPTKHYRLIQDFTVAVRALGAERDKIHQIVVTDYWVDPTLPLSRNPFLELLSSAESALAQPSTDFREQTAKARASLFKGTPLRVVVTRLGDHENREKSMVLEVTGLEKANFDRSVFEVPAGFKHRSGDFNWNLGPSYCCL